MAGVAMVERERDAIAGRGLLILDLKNDEKEMFFLEVEETNQVAEMRPRSTRPQY